MQAHIKKLEKFGIDKALINYFNSRGKNIE